MNLTHLKYVVEIAQTKSISKAAENLFMGQPNLSRAIRELEESLGIAIFNRTPKGITLTPDGEEFLRYAKGIVSQVEQLEDIYTKERVNKQSLSVCVPRASYISYALAEFANHLSMERPAEIFYKETNSMRTIKNVTNGNYNLGIIRYQSGFDSYFKTLFEEKNLTAVTITEFTYVLIMSKDHPLANKEHIAFSDLGNYIEITHADPYVPSLPLIDVKKSELSEYVDKRIFVFERGSQFVLLSNVPTTFMWVSPIPKQLLDRNELVQKECAESHKSYKDVLIYQHGYKPTELDNQFITEVCGAKRKYM